MTEIADFSSRYWGVEQTDRYLAGIDQAVCRAGVDPELGRSVDSRLPNLLRIRAGSHFIIYRAGPTELVVVAILHHRMDLVRHLR